jgi:hypothetical protein
MDSDVQNPDAALAVHFYSREVLQPYLTEQNGRPIYKSMDFIHIEIPGDRNTIIDVPIRPDHIQRFPVQWARYQNSKEDPQIEGTLLKEWGLFTSSQCEELKFFKFYTVEQIASATDTQLSNIQSMCGIAPQALRDRAKAYLDKSKVTAEATATADAIARRDAELAELKEQNDRLQEQLQAILAKLEEPEKRGPGRPKKDPVEA